MQTPSVNVTLIILGTWVVRAQLAEDKADEFEKQLVEAYAKIEELEAECRELSLMKDAEGGE